MIVEFAIVSKQRRIAIFFDNAETRQFNRVFESELEDTKMNQILGVLRGLSVLHPDPESTIQIQLTNLYCYNVMTRYLKKWKDREWTKTNGETVHEWLLLNYVHKLLDTHSVNFRYFPRTRQTNLIKQAYKFLEQNS